MTRFVCQCAEAHTIVCSRDFRGQGLTLRKIMCVPFCRLDAFVYVPNPAELKLQTRDWRTPFNVDCPALCGVISLRVLFSSRSEDVAPSFLSLSRRSPLCSYATVDFIIAILQRCVYSLSHHRLLTATATLILNTPP